MYNADTLLEELEKMIENHNRLSDILYIKIWIFNYIFTPEDCDLNKEKQLYKYLQSTSGNFIGHKSPELLRNVRFP